MIALGLALGLPWDDFLVFFNQPPHLILEDNFNVLLEDNCLILFEENTDVG